MVDTLQQSKITSEAVTHQLVEAELTEKKIDLARLVSSAVNFFVWEGIQFAVSL